MKKIYMRCKNVFSGHSFAFGLFEANDPGQGRLDECQTHLKSSKSVERGMCDSSMMTSIVRQMKASSNIIERSQALSKSAIISGNARMLPDSVRHRQNQSSSRQSHRFERVDAKTGKENDAYQFNQLTTQPYRRIADERRPAPLVQSFD